MTKLISADSHVAIKLEDIRARVPKALQDPFDDAIAANTAADNAMRGGRILSLESWDMEAMRDPGYHDPVARLAAMDRDGVWAEVLYSEVSAFRHFGLVQGEWRPIARGFTDLLTEFAAHDPDRLAVSYQVPILDIEYATAEVLRLAALGARSIHLPNHPSELGLPEYHETSYDPLWSVLSETGIAITHHLGNRPYLFDLLRRDPTPQAAIFTSMPAFALAEPLAWWILTGPLERFPLLKIVFVEPNLYWIPGFLQGLDRKADGRYDLPGLTMKPSEYWHRNMAATFLDDEIGLSLRHHIGVENILWSTDFPHPATSWPHSREVVERQFKGISAVERDLMVHDNAARLYNL